MGPGDDTPSRGAGSEVGDLHDSGFPASVTNLEQKSLPLGPGVGRVSPMGAPGEEPAPHHPKQVPSVSQVEPSAVTSQFWRQKRRVQVQVSDLRSCSSGNTGTGNPVYRQTLGSRPLLLQTGEQ